MKRLALATFALLAAVPATARADILWDLVHDAGSAGDYGTSVSLTNGLNCGPLNTLTCGTIVASSQTTVDVFGNDFDNGGDNGGAGPLGAYSMGAFSEKGLGMCFAGSTASPNGCLSGTPPFKEIDVSPVTGPLYLDLTGVLNSGSLNRIWITSTQAGEAWEIYGSTVGTGPTTGTSYALLCSGTGQNTGFTDISTCGGADLPAGLRFLRFNSVTAGDFSVQAVRFNSIVPEPGTMGLLATGLVALTGAGFIRRRRKH